MIRTENPCLQWEDRADGDGLLFPRSLRRVVRLLWKITERCRKNGGRYAHALARTESGIIRAKARRDRPPVIMKKIVLKGDAISRDAANCLLTVFTCDENQSERTRIISVWIKEVSENIGEAAAHCVAVCEINCISFLVATICPFTLTVYAKKTDIDYQQCGQQAWQPFGTSDKSMPAMGINAIITYHSRIKTATFVAEMINWWSIITSKQI